MAGWGRTVVFNNAPLLLYLVARFRQSDAACHTRRELSKNPSSCSVSPLQPVCASIMQWMDDCLPLCGFTCTSASRGKLHLAAEDSVPPFVATIRLSFRCFGVRLLLKFPTRLSFFPCIFWVREQSRSPTLPKISERMKSPDTCTHMEGEGKVTRSLVSRTLLCFQRICARLHAELCGIAAHSTFSPPRSTPNKPTTTTSPQPCYSTSQVSIHNLKT